MYTIQFVVMVSSCLMKRQQVVVNLFVPFIYLLSCRGDLVSQNNSKHLTAYIERCCYFTTKGNICCSKNTVYRPIAPVVRKSRNYSDRHFNFVLFCECQV